MGKRGMGANVAPLAPAGPTSETSSEDSVISSNLVINGNVESKGGIRVDGTIKGDVDCATLTVSESGAVEGHVAAERVFVHGRVIGSINGRSVMLYATANVEADINHQGVGIEMGTRYDGTLRWVDEAALAHLATERR